VFNQNFSSVAANRNSEFLTDRQRSPSQQVGFAGQWRRVFGRQAVTAGIEGRDVQGHSAEKTFTAAAPKAEVDSGGRQRIIGYFGQDAVHIAQSWVLTFGGRVDTWLNSRGYANSFPLPSGPLTVSDFANHSQLAFSPRVSLLHTFGHGISASASVYQAFRAPTLNELYRNFRVGNTQTNANPNLVAEILTGGEAGVSLQEWGERVTIRGNFFWSDIANPVTNVPISYTPAGCVSNPTTCTLITQQRQNLGEARARHGTFRRMAPAQRLAAIRRIYFDRQHGAQRARTAGLGWLACSAGALERV
jgi:outer membrane receptor protein involved in Fe transport